MPIGNDGMVKLSIHTSNSVVISPAGLSHEAVLLLEECYHSQISCLCSTRGVRYLL